MKQLLNFFLTIFVYSGYSSAQNMVDYNGQYHLSSGLIGGSPYSNPYAQQRQVQIVRQIQPLQHQDRYMQLVHPEFQTMGIQEPRIQELIPIRSQHELIPIRGPPELMPIRGQQEFIPIRSQQEFIPIRNQQEPQYQRIVFPERRLVSNQEELMPIRNQQESQYQRIVFPERRLVSNQENIGPPVINPSQQNQMKMFQENNMRVTEQRSEENINQDTGEPAQRIIQQNIMQQNIVQQGENQQPALQKDQPILVKDPHSKLSSKHNDEGITYIF